MDPFKKVVASVVLAVWALDWLVAIMRGGPPNALITTPLMAVLGGIYGYDMIKSRKNGKDGR